MEVVVVDFFNGLLGSLQSALDCLRVLKDHPRPLIEVMLDPTRLD